jgi:hypothetical protein
MGHSELAMRTTSKSTTISSGKRFGSQGSRPSAAVEAGLKAFVRLNRIRLNRQKKILNLAGKVHWESNLDESREGRFAQ